VKWWPINKPTKAPLESFLEAREKLAEWFRQQDVKAIYEITSGFVPDDTREAILKSNGTEDCMALQAYLQLEDLQIEFLIPTNPHKKRYCRLIRGEDVLRSIDMGSALEVASQGKVKDGD
jgi:hypothetical protein